MLVLSRKAGKSIIIGDNIKVTVLDISEWVVKIGIEAPADVSVHREEVYEIVKEAEKSNDDKKKG